MLAPRQKDLTLLRRLWRQTRPYRAHLLGILLFSLLATPLALLTPLPVKITIDALVGSAQPIPSFLRPMVPDAATSSTTAILLLAASLIVILGLFTQMYELVNSLLKTYTSEKLVLDCRALLFRHMQRLSFAFHDSNGTGDSLYRVQQDTAAIKAIILDGLLPLVSSLFTLVVMIVVASRLDFKLVAMVVALAPVLLLLTHLFRVRCRRQWAEVKTLESSALSVVQEVLVAARVVKAFGQEEREHTRFFQKAVAGLRAQMRAVFSQGLYSFLVVLAMRLAMAAFLFVAARDMLAGELSMGDLVLLMAYMGQVIGPLKAIGQIFTGVQSGLASAERVFAVLDEMPDVAERPDARPLARAAGRVVFRNVGFAYKEDQPVLRNLSFDAPPGTRLGIKGETGAGKTTLVSLLTRFYDPTAGQILLDAVDLRDYKLADLRNQFAIVLQDSLLFSTSIAENIAYGRPSASQDEIIAAAKAAHAHDFIVRLPQSYDTPVGERGMLLSGGERQRIGLARTFLKDAPILILDEPTSSVDVKTEAAILEAMDGLMRGRTTFLISHRLSALEGCDPCLEVHDGQLVPATSPARNGGLSVREHGSQHPSEEESNGLTFIERGQPR